jgi:predicted nucleic acid-binding protein
MKIVIDTNVLISGVFFGGFPRKILSAVVGKEISLTNMKKSCRK